MKKILRLFLNKILHKYGIQTIRIYELKYITEKHREAVDEFVKFLRVTLFKNLKSNTKRNELLTQLYGTTVTEAMYIIFYLNRIFGLEGDVCEFGIANGSTSALIANEIQNTAKHLWLFDSFQGLSKPTEKDILIDDIFNLGSIQMYESTMSYPDSCVKTKLKMIHFPQNKTHIIPGFIEDTIDRNFPKKVSFAYIDFDLYNPTKITLEHLHKNMVKGGHIIVDDYNYFTKGVKTAVDEFIKDNKSEYELILPPKFTGKFCIIYKNIS
jgi:O-methyltransferase